MHPLAAHIGTLEFFRCCYWLLRSCARGFGAASRPPCVGRKPSGACGEGCTHCHPVLVLHAAVTAPNAPSCTLASHNGSATPGIASRCRRSGTEGRLQDWGRLLPFTGKLFEPAKFPLQKRPRRAEEPQIERTEEERRGKGQREHAPQSLARGGIQGGAFRFRPSGKGFKDALVPDS